VVLVAALFPLVGLVAPASASSVNGGGRSDHDKDAYCLSSWPLTIRVTYRYNSWNFGYYRFPIIISWGDGTTTAMPTRPDPHPYDYAHPYEMDHTYASTFQYSDKNITDTDHDGQPRFIVILKRIFGT